MEEDLKDFGSRESSKANQIGISIPMDRFFAELGRCNDS